MNERIIFFGRNKNYNITQLCYKELIRFLKGTRHEVVITVVSDDNHGTSETLESIADSAGLPWISAPKNDVNSPEFIMKLKSLNPTISITVQFPKIFKSELIQIPERACLNIHRGWPYRGGGIDERAIYNKLQTYNVILHHITTGIDTGNIIGKEKFQLSDFEDGYSLVEKADNAGLNLFTHHFLPILGHSIPSGEKQKIEDTIYASKGDLSNNIDLKNTSENIERLCRAFHHPRKLGASLKVKTQNVYLIPPVEVIQESLGKIPGTIISLENKSVLLHTGNSEILVTKCHEGDKIPISFGGLLKQMGLKEGDLIG